MKKKGPPRKLSKDRVAWALKELLTRRDTIRGLAKKLDVSISILRRDLTELHGSKLPTVYPAHWNGPTRWTDDQLKEVVALRVRGLLLGEIGERLGITDAGASWILRVAVQRGLWDGQSIAARLRRQQLKREASARAAGRHFYEVRP